MIDISEDPLYSKGKIEGKLEGKSETNLEHIKHLVVNTPYEDSYIAFLLAVNVELVKEVRENLRKSNIIN